MDSYNGSNYNFTDQSWHVNPEEISQLEQATNRAMAYGIYLGVMVILGTVIACQADKQQRSGVFYVVQCFALVMAIVYNAVELSSCIYHMHNLFLIPGQNTHLDFRLKGASLDLTFSKIKLTFV